MEINSKICTGCEKDRSFSEYTEAKLGKFGLRSKCIFCRAEEAIKYNSAHKEENSARGKKYRTEKAQKISIQRAEHTLKNKERLAEYQKAWREANPGKSNARTARRRASRQKAIPKWLTKEQHREMIAFYDEAAKLTKETGIPHEVDHIEPLQGKDRSGFHVPWNLQVLTKSDNRRKSRKTIT